MGEQALPGRGAWGFAMNHRLLFGPQAQSVRHDSCGPLQYKASGPWSPKPLTHTHTHTQNRHTHAFTKHTHTHTVLLHVHTTQVRATAVASPIAAWWYVWTTHIHTHTLPPSPTILSTAILISPSLFAAGINNTPILACHHKPIHYKPLKTPPPPRIKPVYSRETTSDCSFVAALMSLILVWVSRIPLHFSYSLSVSLLK